MCPSSRFGTSIPFENSADPVPVPSVIRNTVPRRPTPAPNRISATPAASASFTRWTGRPQDALHRVIGVEVDPARIDVGRALGDAVDDDRREPDAHRDRRPDEDLRLDLVHDPRDRRDHGGRRGRLRGRHPVARREQLARVEVDGRGLDPAPADVDADRDPPGPRIDRRRDHLGRLVLVVRVEAVRGDGDGLAGDEVGLRAGLELRERLGIGRRRLADAVVGRVVAGRRLGRVVARGRRWSPGSPSFTSSLSTRSSEVVDGDAAIDDEVCPIRPPRLVGGEVDRRRSRSPRASRTVPRGCAPGGAAWPPRP